MISIAPQSHSPGMFSWFPLFIPLANPLRVHVDDIVTVNVWRYSAFERLSCVCVDGVIILSAVAGSINIITLIISLSYRLRCVDDRKVWYEWSLSAPICTPIQNSGGSSSWIGL